ncbi:S-adenosyl-L-methionine-dependent methyltransferase, putative [Babesia ovata]|uniref:S-adenosyl-L-methionine-dependent methyltransferase, putative n=1 Tax=Babesia ovata TaxID=189622 RepID=A0A2H6KIK0_9APIC|nr:S-adenosyl-L-methionine-dependent methyltransferase, putative [Babesia ovata]GBE62820.1 S-adenosyl-L-methionine-dependent methyltransferase, putative [Babesia ovata]
MRKISFLKFNFLITTLTTSRRIIRTNVVINLLIKSVFEVTSYLPVGFFEIFHEIRTKRYITVLTNLPSRLVNRRPGRILDLCFGFSVELVNGAGKLINFLLKFMYYITFKLAGNVIITILSIHKSVHVRQLLVHGLGCAICGIGWFASFSRLGKIIVKLINRRLDFVQNFAESAGT